jgi:hypothetical protein
MVADFPVVLDACVLAEARVSDLFLRLADAPRLLLPKWTLAIWDETNRTCVEKLGWPQRIADSRRAAALDAFPEAMIEGHEALLAQVANVPKDRHVLAAAVFAKVDVIVTFNLKHFPTAALAP